jgi:hypothetical protein
MVPKKIIAGQPKSEGNESNKQTSQKTITMCRENDRSTAIIAAQLLFTTALVAAEL